ERLREPAGAGAHLRVGVVRRGLAQRRQRVFAEGGEFLAGGLALLESVATELVDQSGDRVGVVRRGPGERGAGKEQDESRKAVRTRHDVSRIAKRQAAFAPRT